MLDNNLLSFVEPIGPGQIVDRESLVALPVGFLQISIDNSSEQLVVKIEAARGIESPEFEKNDLSNFILKSYIWQNGKVLAGAELTESQTESSNFQPRASMRRSVSTLKRRNSGSCKFLFRKQTSENETKHDMAVDAILQVCLYKASKGTVGRKAFLGTVHIALKYLTCNQPKNSTVCLSGRDNWFKVFPKSAFLPGSPSDIAKTNCFISGQSEAESRSYQSEEDFSDDDDYNSYCSTGSTPDSTITFSQYNLSHKTKSGSLPRASNQNKQKPVTTKKSRPQQLRQKSQQQQEKTTNKTLTKAVTSFRRSISMIFVRASSIDDVKATKRNNRIAEDTFVSRSSEQTSPPVLVGQSPTRSRYGQRSCGTLPSKRYPFHYYSSSNESSDDVGYESSRSCSTLTYDDNVRSERLHGAVQNQSSGTSSLARPMIFKPSPLRRSTRISESSGYTSLSEIGKGF